MTVLERDRLDILTRRCPECQKTKTWRDFSPRAYWPDGEVLRVQPVCRDCCSQRELTDARRAQKAAWKRRRNAALRSQRDRNLDAGPLREFLEADGRDNQLLADVTGVTERTLRRLLDGQQCTRLSIADRIITRCGGAFELVYPFEGEA